MRKLLVFQHVPYEPLGTLDGRFRAAGFRIRYVNFHRQPDAVPDVRRYHGLVVLGGPMGADETQAYPHLLREQDAIRTAVELELPMLGICLGAQLLASSLGGRVLRGCAREIGWCEVEATDAGRQDPLIGYFQDSETVFQWHSDTFTLPADAVHLARSQRCEHQAFRVGETAYGLQFHLEADEALIQRWLHTPQYRAELERTPEADPRAVRSQWQRHFHRIATLGGHVFGEFIERFYRWRRRVALPSR